MSTCVCRVLTIRERMVASLRNASEGLAAQVAAGLGIRQLPDPMPRALADPATPEVTISPALSHFAKPGADRIRARKIAILVANGSIGESATEVHASLVAEGAVPRFVAPRIGAVDTADGVLIDADASVENEPGFLFDALVIADGADGVAALKRDGHTMEFNKDQYRHCKTIMAIGAAKALLDAAEASATTPSGDPDPGIIIVDGAIGEAIAAFVQGIEDHRHPVRETDPPLV